MSAEYLSSLHTALVDTREGYRKAIEKAEDADLLGILRSVDGVHAAAHDDIHRILASRGDRPDDGGSLMGTVHGAVVSVRSAVVGLDHGSLAAFASGEEHNLEAYDEAIRDEGDGPTRETLTGHRDALTAKVSEMKRQAEQA